MGTLFHNTATLDNQNQIGIADSGKPVGNHQGGSALRDGKIVEQGTHKELLNLGGYYHELYTRQYQDEATAQILS